MATNAHVNVEMVKRVEGGKVSYEHPPLIEVNTAKRWKCGGCRTQVLFTGEIGPGTAIEIKCSRCGKYQRIGKPDESLEK